MASARSGESGLDRALNAYAQAFQRWLPTPFSIAILLTVVAAVSALPLSSPHEVLNSWVDGLWNPGLMRFGFQAMFMLVLGHVLALAPPVLRMLSKAVDWLVLRPAWAPAKVAMLSMALGWLNWGLGLIGGAILVRGVLDTMRRTPESSNLHHIHAGVLGAAGYTGLLVWHGGISGSAPLKAAESGHLQSLVPQAAWASELPEAMSLRETALSNWSLMVTLAVGLAVIAVFAWLGQRTFDASSRASTDDRGETNTGSDGSENPESWRSGASESWGTAVPEPEEGSANGMVTSSVHGFADRLDTQRGLAYLLGLACMGGALMWAARNETWTQLTFVTPDWINLVLLGFAMVAHGQVRGMLAALDQAIAGASGILVQFPLYFGIMGMVTGTGLGELLAQTLVNLTSPSMLPEALFVSSGLLNIFVPSGGGQWAVQGPLVLEACHALGVPLERGIMAMAFGDELTNMLQPFWALPLLGITGLSARDILPYTLLIMIVAGCVMLALMAFWA
ncbi:MAG: TIGR00366 family protein [Bacteroidetes bacterium]|nr:TIGR00366 family protein [Bacteroidota bacterium]MDA0903535.1 TIGR00366 family protein [Bacteroidota bacterium]